MNGLLSVGRDQEHTIVLCTYPLPVGTVNSNTCYGQSAQQIICQTATVIAVYLNLGKKDVKAAAPGTYPDTSSVICTYRADGIMAQTHISSSQVAVSVYAWFGDAYTSFYASKPDSPLQIFANAIVLCRVIDSLVLIYNFLKKNAFVVFVVFKGSLGVNTTETS